MALFIDSEINDLRDLQRHECGILDVTSSEQIDITSKTGLAQELITASILVFLLRHSSREPGGALFGSQSNWRRRELGVSDVVLTEPLKRWHALKCLELIYQDAYYNQLNDRYKGKWMQYEQRAATAEKQLLQIGIGLVADPVGKAQPPLLVAVAGPTPATSYYVRVAWLNFRGQEGLASDVVGLQTVDGTRLVVSAQQAPSNASGWNVFAGLTPEGVTLQNDIPVNKQSDWTIPVTGLRKGRDPGNGQVPERYVVNEQVNLRG